MKRLANYTSVLLLVSSVVLSICIGCSVSGSGQCEGGICVDVELTEPVYIDEPVEVTITIETNADMQGLKASLWFSDPDIAVDGKDEWTVDTEAHTAVQVSTIIRFTQEGYYDVVAGVLDHSGQMITDYVPVHITTLGGTLHPQSERGAETPAPLERLDITPTLSTPVSPLDTPSIAPTPFPTRPVPFDTSLPDVPLKEWIAHCHWPSDVEQIPEEWEGTSVWVAFPEDIFPHSQFLAQNADGTTEWMEVPPDIQFHPLPLNTSIPITIGVYIEGVPKGPSETTHLELAICLADRAVQVEGPSQWSLQTRTKGSLTFQTQLVFREEGIFNIRVGVREPASGQVAWGGYRVRVSADKSSAVPIDPPSGRSTFSPVHATGGTWQKIADQDFEGAFPSAGWSVQDLSNDGYERYWDDDNYRANQGYWAAWPANEGADRIYPSPDNDNYPNNMNTRMIYGPFDLSDAVKADTWFWLWREIEQNYDYLVFEISHDGIAFHELARWSDENKTWMGQDVDYDKYVGDDSVWVAWRFYSDYMITKEGPWVDDITIWKYVAGQVTPQGWFYFYDRDDNQTPARHTRVHIYDADPGGEDDLLDSTTTDANGFWQVGPLDNWDDDDPGPLDLYAVFETDIEDSDTARRRVTNFGSWAYKWQIPTQDNVPDGMVDLGAWAVGDASDWEPAMWVFQDLLRAWEYVRDNTSTDPGSVTARWEKDKTSFLPCTGSCQMPYPPISGIFISHPDRNAPDIVIHELGHQYMYNAMGSWWWPNVDDMLECLSHGIQGQENPLCAWTEGWADFLPLAVNGDQCFDWNNTPCSGLDLETPTWGTAGWDDGDEVEGRVAGSLYDLFDQSNDGSDQTAFGFEPIWAIVHTVPGEQSFLEFWDSWETQGYNQHRAVQALYQNTIDYDSAPVIVNLPDCTALQSLALNNAIDLWLYSSDEESHDWELEWLILHSSDWHCRVTLDSADFVDINPWSGWLGSCDVTIQVSDGIKTDSDSFTINVVPVVGRAYLPLVMRGYGGGSVMAVQDDTPSTLRSFESPLPIPERPTGMPETFRSPLPVPEKP